jgi:hypothetical protein
MDVRSYRRVFDLERRIYRIDRVRLNPSGVPVRGVVYLLALVLASVLLVHLPGARVLARALPWYACELALPLVLAAVLAIVSIDGRPFHVAALALARVGVEGRTLVGLCPRRASACSRWTPPPLLLIPDGSDARVRRFRYTGPGAVRLGAAHERYDGGRVLVALRASAHVIVSGAVRSGGEGTVAASSDEVVVLERGARCATR